MILENKILEPCFIEKTFMRGFKPYSHMCQASLRWFFIKTYDKIYPDLVREFYTNILNVGKPHISPVKNIKIVIHKECFGKIFELPFLGTSYKTKKPTEMKNFKRSVALNYTITNPMEERKIPFRKTLQEPKVRILHYPLTRILLLRNTNNNHIIKSDINLLWLLK